EPKMPGLPRLTREPLEKEKVEMTTPPPAIVRLPQNLKPLPTPSSSASPSPSSSPSSTAGPAHSESIPELIATSSQKPTLDAYDISYWIKKGPNTIVATVRNTQGPAWSLALSPLRHARRFATLSLGTRYFMPQSSSACSSCSFQGTTFVFQ